MPWTVSLIPEAESELMRMPADIRARFLRVAELLETFGPQQVGMPHVRPLEGKLWEMRRRAATASPARSMWCAGDKG